MTYLYLDFETYSEVDIKSAGTYRYAADPSTRPLMLAWAVNDSDINLWQAHKDGPIPGEIMDLLGNQTVVKRAYNAAFERLILKHTLGIDIPIEQWQCSQVAALALGFPANLDGVLGAIGLGKKDPRGTKLIHRFSKPAPKNHHADRYDWDSHPEEWEAFCEYCVRDVQQERALWLWLSQHRPNLIWGDWYIDQHINARGMPFDLELAEAADKLLTGAKRKLKQQMQLITGLDKVTRGPIMAWFASQGLFLPNTQKDTLERALMHGLPDQVADVCKAWTEYSSRAGDKFKAALRSAVDGRLHGVFQMNGAARTGRTAGRIIQPHNLRSTIVADDASEQDQIDKLTALIKANDLQGIREAWPGELLSHLIGSAVRHGVASPQGETFAVCDWSSIESRILGWLTYCSTINQTFASGQDTYKVFASKHFGVPYERVTREQRKFAKPPVLGCGYQLGVDGLIRYAEGYGVALSVEESSMAVDTFRTMYAEVPAFWYWIEQSVKNVVQEGRSAQGYRLSIWRDAEFLYIQLPSGRTLHYFQPRLERKRAPWCEEDDPDPDYIWMITYMGVSQFTNQWTRLDTYGGKLTENIVQAIAADVLRDGLRALASQMDIVLHVHDEIVALVPKGEGQQKLALMQELMSQSPVWAKDLLLGAEGWTGTRYAKF